MKTLKSFAVVLIVPTLYAMLVRGFYGVSPWENLYQVMLMSFIVGVPVGVGAITQIVAPHKWAMNWFYTLFAPWAPAIFFFLLTLALAWEGWICWVMILPFFQVFASVGSVLMHLIRFYLFKKTSSLNVTAILLIPFLFAPIESRLEVKPKIFSAVTYIDIKSTKEKIWSNVTRVRIISEAEDKRKISRFMKFPRPLFAELDTHSVGGRRLATFDKGLVFDEVVNVYEHEKKMSFSITPLTNEIPPVTMDEHIIVGGKYFTVLDGTYELEKLNDETYRLHLTSRFQLRTSFNFYSGLWSEWIMKDIQNNILQIIKERSE